MNLRERWEDFVDSDWYFEHVWRPCNRVRYFLRYTLWGRKPAPPPPLSPEMQSQMDALIKALERGGYDAAPGVLTQGSPLIIEDLSPVMRCVTFVDPNYYRLAARRMERLRNIARFFRLRALAHDLDEASIYFADQYDKHKLRWFDNKARAKALLDYGSKMVEEVAKGPTP